MGTALRSQYKSQSNVLRIHSQHCTLFFSFIWFFFLKSPEEYMTNGESKAMPFIISIGALLICWYEIQKLAEGFPRQNKFGLLLNKDAAVCVERGACRIQSSLVPNINGVVPRHTFFASERISHNGRDANLTHQDESPSPGADGQCFLFVLLWDQTRSHRSDPGCCVGDLLNSLEKLPWKLFVWILMKSFSGL